MRETEQVSPFGFLLLLFSLLVGLGFGGYERHNNVMGISRSEAPGRPHQIDGRIVD